MKARTRGRKRDRQIAKYVDILVKNGGLIHVCNIKTREEFWLHRDELALYEMINGKENVALVTDD